MEQHMYVCVCVYVCNMKMIKTHTCKQNKNKPHIMDGIVCSIVRSYLSEDRLHITTRIKHVPVTQSNS